MNRNTARLTGVFRRALVVVCLVVLSGCQTGPPVQEMSDARQAIAVAREAGAADRAPGPLREAEAYLQSARRNLSDKAYSEARSDAVLAKNKALDALASAESTDSDNDSPR